MCNLWVIIVQSVPIEVVLLWTLGIINVTTACIQAKLTYADNCGFALVYGSLLMFRIFVVRVGFNRLTSLICSTIGLCL